MPDGPPRPRPPPPPPPFRKILNILMSKCYYYSETPNKGQERSAKMSGADAFFRDDNLILEKLVVPHSEVPLYLTSMSSTLHLVIFFKECIIPDHLHVASSSRVLHGNWLGGSLLVSVFGLFGCFLPVPTTSLGGGRGGAGRRGGRMRGEGMGEGRKGNRERKGRVEGREWRQGSKLHVATGHFQCISLNRPDKCPMWATHLGRIAKK